MQIFGSSGSYAGAASNILSLLFGRNQAGAGQTAPIGNNAGADTTQASSHANGTTASQFSSATFQSLLSAQQRAYQPPTSGDLAAKLITNADRNGDGQLNLSEVENALGGSSANGASISAGFAKLDTDGNGEISASELTTAINSFRQAHSRSGSTATPTTNQVSATA